MKDSFNRILHISTDTNMNDQHSKDMLEVCSDHLTHSCFPSKEAGQEKATPLPG